MNASERNLVREALALVVHAPREEEMGWVKHLLYEEERAQVIEALRILDAADECPHGCIDGEILGNPRWPMDTNKQDCPECKPSAKADGCGTGKGVKP